MVEAEQTRAPLLGVDDGNGCRRDFEAEQEVERDAEKMRDDGTKRVAVADDGDGLGGMFDSQLVDAAHEAGLGFQHHFTSRDTSAAAIAIKAVELRARLEFG